MSSFNWPPKGGSGIAKYPTFADFPPASSVADGTLAIALDTQTLYESNGVVWTAIASPGAINTFDDTNSIDLTNTAGVITADLNLSSDPADPGYKPVGLSIEPDGLKAQINDLDIQVAVFVADTPSVNMSNDGVAITADVNLSAAAAPGGSILSPLSIETDGLRAVTPIMVGDSGAGGVAGVVPAPGAGSAATGAFLKADGTWTVPAGTSASLAFAYGGGVDGNVTVSSQIQLTRDMYYNNLTITAGGQILTVGFRIFVAGVLDLTSAPADSIVWSIPGAGDGANAVGSVAGAGGGSVGSASGAMIGPAASGAGTAGGTGGTAGGTGTTASAGGAVSVGANGGQAGNGGKGGAGVAAGGAQRLATTLPTTRVGPMARFTTDFYMLFTGTPNTIVALTGGTSGVGGSGGGSGAPSGIGGGGGGGGASRGIVFVCCNSLLRTGAASGCISVNGDKGGNGANAASASIGGGGGGGSGAGGGWIYFAYAALGDATAATDLFTANGGNGGNGGNGFGGDGVTTGLGGDGGGGGAGGRITVFNLATGAYITAYGGTQVAGAAQAAGVGGAGATGQATGVTL